MKVVATGAEQAAYEEGTDAFHDGMTISDNPYREDMLVDAWGDGFMSAEADEAEANERKARARARGEA